MDINTNPNITNDELLEFLCYDKLTKCNRLQLESSYFKCFMHSKNELSIYDLLKHVNRVDYLVDILNVSRKNNIAKETRHIIYNKLFSSREGIECFIEHVNKSIITIECIEILTKTIIDNYDDLLYKWTQFVPKDKAKKAKLPQRYKDILDGYLILSTL